MDSEDKYVRHTYSYLDLRKAVGWIGVLLPFALVLVANSLGSGPLIERSISYYYHTVARDVFVGALCAVALFLFFYSGYDDLDNWTGNVAGAFAIGVAWFPTTRCGPNEIIGLVHLVCAAGFFLSLSFFSIFRFTKTDDRDARTPEKLVRNAIYYVCGGVMVASLFAMLVYMLVADDTADRIPFVFVAETIGLIAFGVSWLTKGETLYPDRTEGKTVRS